MHLKYIHYFGNESSEGILEAYGIMPNDKQPRWNQNSARIVTNQTNQIADFASNAEWY